MKVGAEMQRAAHLFVSEPRLFAKKAWQRLKRIWFHANATVETPREIAQKVNDAVLPVLVGEIAPMVALQQRNDLVVYGIRASDLPALLTVINKCLPNADVFIDGRESSLTLLSRLRKGFTASSVGVRAVDGPLWLFHVYDPTEEGSYVCRSGGNAIADILYGDLFAKLGVNDLTLCLPELSRRLDKLPIDIVYTWVDSKDPTWSKAFKEAALRPSNGDATADSRFHSSDELRYSLRSVNTHASWARTICIVSNCSPPKWLDTNHTRLRWVQHAEILDDDCLPTFNSHAIEASLHRIPGLSENFLYFNDDFFVFDTLTPEDFINENGTLNANLEPKAVVNSDLDPLAPDYLNAARNGARLLYERYGYHPTRLHQHSPYSLSRSLLEQLEDEFEETINETRRARFRSVTDLSVASFLAHHYGFVRREVVYASYPAELVKSNDPFFALKMGMIARGADKPKVVCLNEGGTPSMRWRRQLARFMAAQFPNAAPWEVNCLGR